MPSSLLKRIFGRPAAALSRWLLAPSELRAAWVRQRLVQSLEEVLPPAVQSTHQGLAIVEGALALSLADGSFDQREWQLYQDCLARLQLSDSQLRSINLQGIHDPIRIGSSLASLQDPKHRLAVGRCYCLFAAVDGETGTAERGLLQSLLQALDHPELEQGLPALCQELRPQESWLERQRTAWGEGLARWLLPASTGRSRRG